MMRLFLIALPVFLALDALWLGVIAKNFYRQQIGFLMKSDINWIAAGAFYLLFLAGLVTFVIAPAMAKHSWQSALTLGAFFGLVTYATYDLTNLAVVKDWPLAITFADLAWGAAIAAITSTVTVLIAERLA